MGLAFTIGGFLASLVAFLTAAATLVMLILVAALATASGQGRLLARLRAVTPIIKSGSGYIVVAVGTWFILLGIFAEFFAELFPV